MMDGCSNHTRHSIYRKVYNRKSFHLFFFFSICILTIFRVEGQEPKSILDFDDDDLDDFLSSGGGGEAVPDQEDIIEELDVKKPPIMGKAEPSDSQKVNVLDYLEQLDNDALRIICQDRGFDVLPRRDGLPLERSDYVEAARRCLSLEDEMNAILAQNPDLAAELEAEIARMLEHKDRLEHERAQLLSEKARLEEQLEQAGLELQEAHRQNNNNHDSTTTTRNSSASSSSALRSKKAPEDMTVKEVLIETFSQLYDRVRLDVEFAWKFLGPVVRPVKGSIQLLWRYCRPHLKALGNELVKRFHQIFGIARTKIEQVMAETAAAAADAPTHQQPEM